MHPTLQMRYDRLLDETAKLKEKIEGMSEEQLNFKPSLESWSVTQVCHHLYLGESLTLQNIKRYFGRNKETAGLGGKIKSALLFNFLRSKRKAVAPVPTNLKHTEAWTFDEVWTNWDSFRVELKEYLENYPKESINWLVFKHPMAGMLSLPHTLEFYVGHITHHMHQIDRLKKHADWPK